MEAKSKKQQPAGSKNSASRKPKRDINVFVPFRAQKASLIFGDILGPTRSLSGACSNKEFCKLHTVGSIHKGHLG